MTANLGVNKASPGGGALANPSPRVASRVGADNAPV